MNNGIQNTYVKMIDDYMLSQLDSPFNELDGIYESMKYSVKNGGKRVRPVLTLLFADACGGKAENAIPLACAVEFIHTYSLIHDDLPCMDDDDYRRGNLSNHKVFGEANALLAGDSLLTAAFGLIGDGVNKGYYSAARGIKAVSRLSELAGASGMAGGQFIDLDGEGKSLPIEMLSLMDRLKTGALIKAACVLGCISAGADEEKIKAAEVFAESIGLAFQIKDDILDVTSSLEQLGKKTGSDEENHKSTYVSLLGLEKCRSLVAELTEKAIGALDTFKNNGKLKEYAAYLSEREN